MFDFDRIIDRRGTHSSKWDQIAKLSGISAPDAIAMWVADMDFAAPPGVTAALQEETARGVHGYYADNGSWAEALAGWLKRRHSLTIDPAWVTPVPGIVAGLSLLVQAVSEPGDEVVLFPPVYHAFRRLLTANDRKIIDAQLINQQGRYAMDFDALAKLITPRTKIIFLSSPHNPGGTVWTPDELRILAEFCAARKIVLASDEIHCDLIFSHAKHTPTLTAAPHTADWIVSCFAATKTFNLAGAHMGALVTSNAALRAKINGRVAAANLTSLPSFGMIATEAAWRTGDAWLDALMPYLEGNRNLFDAGIVKAVPGARPMKLDSTYLAWVDFSGTGLTETDVAERIARRARIFASPGPQFGPGGATWLRFNFATPRPVVEEAIARIGEAFSDVRS